jgi:hypothetical protein
MKGVKRRTLRRKTLAAPKQTTIQMDADERSKAEGSDCEAEQERRAKKQKAEGDGTERDNGECSIH